MQVNFRQVRAILDSTPQFLKASGNLTALISQVNRRQVRAILDARNQFRKVASDLFALKIQMEAQSVTPSSDRVALIS